ncbi:MAG: type II toxin-antitoxin system Phd/YefM family antitoxin [Methylovulum sp.]|nr:type II toxin-antitoxin system Phd/YefM family antitoxin [Methylovulum sp.]
MYQANIHQAKTQLSKLLEDVAQSEEIIIAKAGKPIAKLIPLEKSGRKPRVSGCMKDQIWVADDFDQPMGEEELALWYDSPIFPADK